MRVAIIDEVKQAGQTIRRSSPTKSANRYSTLAKFWRDTQQQFSEKEEGDEHVIEAKEK
jgi:hypothetical protein